MNCEDFRNALDTLPGPDLPSGLSEHASSCRACLRCFEAHKKLFQGLNILKRVPQPPDFTKPLLERIELPAETQVPLWKKVVWLFLPKTPLHSSLFYGGAFLLILGLGYFVLHQAQRKPALDNVDTTPQLAWHQIATPNSPIPLAEGQSLFFGDARLEHPRAHIQVENAAVALASTGVRLQEGAADLRVTRGPFHVWTPFADVMVLGTSFSVRVTKEDATVSVLSGTVLVRKQNWQRHLGAGQSCVAGPNGIREPSSPSHPLPSPHVPDDPADPNRIEQPTE